MTKKILITGKTSYVGNKLAEWLSKNSNKYEIVKKSVRDDNWKTIDFSNFDAIVHVAGIAHQDTKANQEDLYYKINTDLTFQIAYKAKMDGVKQFVFMSSMIVYGASSKIGEKKIINKETVPEPTNFYGNSKLLAEKAILPLQSHDFNVVVIRPPMIYGKDSKGNYPLLSKFAKISPFFPNIENQRSMLHVDNLSEFIRLLIDNEEMGIYFPQNSEYVKTAEMVQIIAENYGKNIKLIKLFNVALTILGKKSIIINKVFGSFIYDMELSEYKEKYRIRDLKESIKITEA